MSIDVQQPRPYDLVTNQIQIAGMAGGARSRPTTTTGSMRDTMRSPGSSWPATARVDTGNSS